MVLYMNARSDIATIMMGYTFIYVWCLYNVYVCIVV